MRAAQWPPFAICDEARRIAAKRRQAAGAAEEAAGFARSHSWQISMTPQEPIVVSIPAHHTPHPSDPPDAHEFYAALGMLSVAWGRLEGHVNGNLLTIVKFPQIAPPHKMPTKWDERRKLWERAFSEGGSATTSPRRRILVRGSRVARTKPSPRHRLQMRDPRRRRGGNCKATVALRTSRFG